MKTLLGGFVVLVTLCWAQARGANPTPAPYSLWALREDALYLSGLLSIALMSLAMVLATRPAPLEKAFNGMDKVYRTHKWAGILAVAFAAAHWLVEMSGDLIKALVGRSGRLPKEHLGGFLDILRDLAKDLGEWAIYAAIAMLAITLWKRFPFNVWRTLHRLMPIIYLTLAFHALALAPLAYWQEPVGILLAALLAAGTFASIHVLAGRVGRSRRHAGHIASLGTLSPDLTEVDCKLDSAWPAHRPGQFAFVTFSRGEGAHPFTIANAPHSDRTIKFEIKGLGDYTTDLAAKLRVGQPIEVEGPYGCFDIPRRSNTSEQIWVAAGIGVTPFLAWLEALARQPAKAPGAHLYYCIRDRDTDPFVHRLESACADIPAIELSVISSDRDPPLDATRLAGHHKRSLEIWFCGPMGLIESLKTGLRSSGLRCRFHQEAFELR